MPNEVIFYVLAILTAGSAVAAMSLRNLVHCGLCLIGTFVGLAALYLQLNAEFVGFAQILVYAGAVGILLVFAILLTRGGEVQGGFCNRSLSPVSGFLVAIVLLSSIALPIYTSRS